MRAIVDLFILILLGESEPVRLTESETHRLEKCFAQAAEHSSNIVHWQLTQQLDVTIHVLVARRPVAMMAFGIASPVEVRVAWIYHALAVSRNVFALTIGVSGRGVCT
jgi:hypothetical protein